MSHNRRPFNLQQSEQVRNINTCRYFELQKLSQGPNNAERAQQVLEKRSVGFQGVKNFNRGSDKHVAVGIFWVNIEQRSCIIAPTLLAGLMSGDFSGQRPYPEKRAAKRTKKWFGYVPNSGISSVWVVRSTNYFNREYKKRWLHLKKILLRVRDAQQDILTLSKKCFQRG